MELFSNIRVYWGDLDYVIEGDIVYRIYDLF
jgi:hypothetical protein